jgi:hypothetical protein
MSAIKPHLEEQNDPSVSEAETEYFSKKTFEEKLAAGGAKGLDGVYPVEAEAWGKLQTAHSEQLRLGFSRKVTLRQLDKREVTVEGKQYRDGTGEVLLVLNEPVAGAEWNAAGGGKNRKTDLLSWTLKMGCPSFSLPAGAPHMGGSCPGAQGGQSIIPTGDLLKGQEHVTRVTGLPVSLPDSVCERCYATGANYIYGSNVLGQSVRLNWVQAALRDKTFVDVMSWAVEHADYLTGGGLHGTGKTAVAYGPENFPGVRFFRIHDSGDFFGPTYLKAWKAVANRFKSGPNRIIFWAPTRIWATNWGVDAVKAVNTLPGGEVDPDNNLIIRPSIYHVNEARPDVELGNGWSDWSVVFHQKVKGRLLKFDKSTNTSGKPAWKEPTNAPVPFNWDCQAYSVDDEAHSCRNARGPRSTGVGPQGDTGCRACWLAPDASINYTEH